MAACNAVRSVHVTALSFDAIGYDLLYLTLFSIVAMTLATQLFRRTL